MYLIKLAYHFTELSSSLVSRVMRRVTKWHKKQKSSNPRGSAFPIKHRQCAVYTDQRVGMVLSCFLNSNITIVLACFKMILQHIFHLSHPLSLCTHRCSEYFVVLTSIKIPAPLAALHCALSHCVVWSYGVMSCDKELHSVSQQHTSTDIQKDSLLLAVCKHANMFQ